MFAVNMNLISFEIRLKMYDGMCDVCLNVWVPGMCSAALHGVGM